MQGQSQQRQQETTNRRAGRQLSSVPRTLPPSHPCHHSAGRCSCRGGLVRVDVRKLDAVVAGGRLAGRSYVAELGEEHRAGYLDGTLMGTVSASVVGLWGIVSGCVAPPHINPPLLLNKRTCPKTNPKSPIIKTNPFVAVFSTIVAIYYFYLYDLMN